MTAERPETRDPRSENGDSRLPPLASPAPRLALRHEIARKAIHLTTGVVPTAYAAGAPRDVLAWALAAMAVVAVTAEFTRLRHERAGVLLHRTVGTLFRAHERDRWSGATWLALAHLVAVLFLPRDAAVAAMWAVSIGDAAAAIVGHAFGRHRLGLSAKSVEGSAACFVATLAGALTVARLPVAEGLLAAAAATVAEWPHRPFDDNIRIVATVGGCLLLARALAG